MDERVLVPLDEGTLRQMGCLAEEEMDRFFQIAGGKYTPYRGRLIAACLCQGAALHWRDPRYGIKDVDVWLFFEEHEHVKLPQRRNMRKSKIVNFTTLGERRIDFMKKMIPSNFVAESASRTIEQYLRHSQTGTAARLREKPVIGLFPDSLFRKVIWDPRAMQPKVGT